MVIGFLGSWLAGWATSEVFALRAVLAPAPLPARAFLLLWLAFWTLGGAFALAARAPRAWPCRGELVDSPRSRL